MEEEQQNQLQSSELFVQVEHVKFQDIIPKGKQYQETTNPNAVFQYSAQPIQVQDVNQATQWGVTSNNNGQLLNEFEEKQEESLFKQYDLDTIIDYCQNEEMYDIQLQYLSHQSEDIEKTLNQGILNYSNTLEWKICQYNQKKFIEPLIHQIFVENFLYIIENRYLQPLSQLINLEQVQDDQCYDQIKKYDCKLNKQLNKFYMNQYKIHYQCRKQRDLIKFVYLKPRLL